MSTIAIFGGTGYAGGHIAAEAARRGHTVISWSRSAPTAPQDGVEYRTGSIADTDVLALAAKEADDVVVALHADDVDGHQLVDLLPGIAATVAENDARLSFVGGAGSSFVADGGPRLVETPEFEEQWKPTALAHADVLTWLEGQDSGLRWFYVSPPGLFGSYAPGETRGTYRIGGDVLVVQEDGSSEISGTDFALAFVDEIENAAHPNRRITVGH